jgi:hypothetical protein
MNIREARAKHGGATTLINIDYYQELERIATEYETNKHYIELGKAVEKALGSKQFFMREWGITKKYETIKSTDELLEWAERTECI